MRHEANQIDDLLAIRNLLGERAKAFVSVAQNNQLGVLDDALEITVEQG